MIYIHAVAVVSASEFRMEEYTRAIPLITLCTTEGVAGRHGGKGNM